MSSQSGNPARKWVFGAVAVVVLVAAFMVSRQLMLTSPKAERRAPERRARLVEVVEVKPGPQRAWVSAYGQVEASQQVSLSAQVSGVVTDISDAFVPGQRVEKGTPLVQLDDRDYRVALDSAQSSLSSAQASLAQEQGSQAVARGDFDLLGLDVDEAEKSLMLRQPQLRAAQATVAAARASVSRAKLDLERTRIRSPFDALILSREVGVGAQVAGPATVLGELAKASPYWVTLLVPVESLQWIDVPDSESDTGAKVQIHDVSQAQSVMWTGEVIQLLDAVEEQGRRARLLVEVNDISSEQGNSLLIGSYVEALIEGRELQDVFKLDPAWLQEESVWVVRDERLKLVPLNVLHRSTDAVLARGALNTGEKIVSSRLSSGVDGMKVRLPEASQATLPERGPDPDRSKRP